MLAPNVYKGLSTFKMITRIECLIVRKIRVQKNLSSGATRLKGTNWFYVGAWCSYGQNEIGLSQKPSVGQLREVPRAQRQERASRGAKQHQQPPWKAHRHSAGRLTKKILTIILLGQVGNLFIVTVEHTDTEENFDSFAINFPALQQWNERKISLQILWRYICGG